MLIHDFQAEGRSLPCKHLEADLVVVGGGLAGVCSSITAAREGLRVLLVQDRPVLGGNASSEVRLWALGATSHMGNNNRWAREGGVINEILLENLWRNSEGNPILFDALLIEFITHEPNITLLLNTAVSSVEMNPDGRIAKAYAYCSQNETFYWLSAPLFCDASGDGILGFLSGATFRIGAEAASEFNECLAGQEPKHELLGHSLYFYSRDSGKPVTFVPPEFALKNISEILRFRELRVSDSGCRLWWLEYGGDLDTVHDTEAIKWELWRVAYGVWNHIKNSGQFPEAVNLTLEWMGMIPGKRESRRFEGDYILTQRDIVEQRSHTDAVSVGGWAIDIHPPQGVFSSAPACVQWHSKGVYQIPFRTMYSRNVPNLFLTGRLISTSHIAFGSTRVMLTCAHNAQAVGMAAAMCKENTLLPRDLLVPELMRTLQQRLLRSGQYIPGISQSDPTDLARKAQLSASSTLCISKLASSGEMHVADTPCALSVPIEAGAIPEIEILVDAATDDDLSMELWLSSKPGNTTPDLKVATAEAAVRAGTEVPVRFHFDVTVNEPAHAFFFIPARKGFSLHLSKAQLPGTLTLWQKMNRMVAKSPIQDPPEGSGIDRFAFWLPDRRPQARNLAATFNPPINCYAPSKVVNGWGRPWCGANAWAPDGEDPAPRLSLRWDRVQTLKTIEITFDVDFDHPLESVLMGHPERVMPGCTRTFQILTAEGKILADIAENHQAYWRTVLPEPVMTNGLDIVILKHGPAPPAIFEVRCF